MTEADTTWTLEIRADGTYTLANEYQSFEGEYTFFPSPDSSMGDRLWFKLDPEHGIEMMLENTANALVDLSGQGLIFVKPGNKADLDEAEEDIEEIEPEDFLGEWKLDSIDASYKDFSMFFSAEEILEGSGGERWIILSLKDGVISQLSAENYLRVPIARYRWIGDDTFVFNNPVKMNIYQTYTGFIVNPKLMVMTAFPEPKDTSCMMFFTRAYGIVVNEGEE